jgi:hypothetical protein
MDHERTTEGTWYCRIQQDLTDMDTVPLKLLPISATAKPAAAAAQPAGGDPYNRDQSVMPERSVPAPRRTLDDMRKLSEQIKRMRASVAS